MFKYKADPQPITRFPCGARDDSFGNLWACVNHCRGCLNRDCQRWLVWFYKFRFDYIAEHKRLC